MSQVSVIIPNFNHAEYLERRIRSVLAQTFDDMEVIILDDCSTDNSRNVIGEYVHDPRVRVVFCEKNSGNAFVQWNRGIRLSTGEYLWIAESDDWAEPDLLSTLVARLESNSKAVLAYCQSWQVDKNEHRLGSAKWASEELFPGEWDADFCINGRLAARRFLCLRNVIPNASAVVFRRSAYDQVGGAREDLFLSGDWDFWGRLALEGEIEYCAGHLNHWRIHSGTVRAQTETMGVRFQEAAVVMTSIAEASQVDSATWRRICYLILAYRMLLGINVPWPILAKARTAATERPTMLWIPSWCIHLVSQILRPVRPLLLRLLVPLEPKRDSRLAKTFRRLSLRQIRSL